MTILRDWEDLPDYMKTDEVRPHYDLLAKKKRSLIIKRIFDLVVATLMLIMMLPIFLIVAILIKKDSKGPVFFRQERVTQYGKTFRIHKFRTMVQDAEQLGTQVSTHNDARITKLGQTLRKYRIDEFPQLIDIIEGNMSFVGVRPEVQKYVDHYTNEMYATLLLPAGITSKTSIEYIDEGRLLNNSTNPDETYINEVLPGKMKINLEGLDQFDWKNDINIMLWTILAVLN